MAGLAAYPFDTIRSVQMVNCCTASKAISIIHKHPDGLWEGYSVWWLERKYIEWTNKVSKLYPLKQSSSVPFTAIHVINSVIKDKL